MCYTVVRMKHTTVSPEGDKVIFLSFVEEYWPNMTPGYVLGRIEVTRPDDHYQSEEIRIACKDSPELIRFINKYDFTYVSEKMLNKVRERAKSEFLLGGKDE